MIAWFAKAARSLTRPLDIETTTIKPSIVEGAPQLFWESDKMNSENSGKPYTDLFESTVKYSIPEVTPKPVVETHYPYPDLNAALYATQSTIEDYGVTAAPNPGAGVSSSGRDAGVVAGIVIAVVAAVIIIGALIAVLMYRHYLHRNVTSMNFDNPVYRKTTEEQFQLEKNGYPGTRLYPSTVAEEAQEPLNAPATNDFV